MGRAVGRMVRAYGELDGWGGLPVAGGMRDQANPFSDSVRVIGAERGQWEAMVEQARERKAKQRG